MSSEIEAAYSLLYRKKDPLHVYPVEFVVRAFLGRYPRLDRTVASYAGLKVLDLGFGDGRNMPLLSNLGMEVHGVEISESICAQAVARLRRLGVDLDARVGKNNAIPYPDQYFDQVLACHACYYVERGTSFADNVKEIARVAKPGAGFVFSLPVGTSYIMRGARDTGNGLMEIQNDPYGVRNGYMLQKFDTEAEIALALAPEFGDLRIGACKNDFWGIEEHVWVVVGKRA